MANYKIYNYTDIQSIFMYTSVNVGRKPFLNVTFVSPFFPNYYNSFVRYTLISEMKIHTTSKNKKNYT